MAFTGGKKLAGEVNERILPCYCQHWLVTSVHSLNMCSVPKSAWNLIEKSNISSKNQYGLGRVFYLH